VCVCVCVCVCVLESVVCEGSKCVCVCWRVWHAGGVCVLEDVPGTTYPIIRPFTLMSKVLAAKQQTTM